MDLDLNRLQFLSFFAICKASLGIIFSRKKYGVCRTSLIHFSCLSLEICSFSMFIVSFRFTYEYQKNYMNFSAIILSHLKSTWFSYLQLIVLLPYFYLNSISSAVYTVACIFSGKEEILSPNDVKKIIQSLFKRAWTTFLWSVAITGSYTILGGFLAFFCVFFDCFRLVGAVILIFYLMGFVYISSVSHLALVVSIVEDVHGLEAFVRSKSLIREKLASGIFLLGFSSAAIIVFLLPFLFYLVSVESVFSTPLAGVALVVVVALGLMGSATTIPCLLVAETIVYFICKSHPDDDIEKSLLAGLLTNFFDEVYAAIPSTADEGQAEIAEKPSIFSLKNPWIAFLFEAVCMSLLMVVLYFVNMVE